jgi:tRNA dimethylallyltransferase
MPDSSPRAFFLVGPTATGKTAVAQRLAEQRHADILSADSMLVYRGMDVGTAKPSLAERRRIRYWGVDVVEPSESYSVAAFLEEARQCFESAGARGLPVIVVGGTGLYVKALLEGLDELPDIPQARRSYWKALLDREGVAGLRSVLQRLKPDWLAELPDINNGRRLVRALELVEAGVERPPRSWLRGRSLVSITGLEVERRSLHERISVRVREMYASGLLGEVKRLLDGGWRADSTASQAIGYAEAIACLKGELTQAEAMARTAARTRQLAKRQMTWFRHQASVKWISVTLAMTLEDVADRVSAEWDASGPLAVVLD